MNSFLSKNMWLVHSESIIQSRDVVGSLFNAAEYARKYENVSCESWSIISKSTTSNWEISFFSVSRLVSSQKFDVDWSWDVKCALDVFTMISFFWYSMSRSALEEGSSRVLTYSIKFDICASWIIDSSCDIFNVDFLSCFSVNWNRD